MAKKLSTVPYRKGKNSKSKAKTQCKCLTCDKATREKFDGKTLLICGDEACALNCESCTERPISGCGFKEMVVVIDQVMQDVHAV